MRDNRACSRPNWPTRATEGAIGVSQTSWRKSSFSNGTGTSCVEVAWRKSSFSNDIGTDCVEVAWSNHQPRSTSDAVLVRDSKNPGGGVLTVPTAAWRDLLDR
ncbi:DUF397 domain-containing protein [Actinophytocola sp.]|uniref:DUF397 domain-containing protein n=1 Tax=Actinophytocola sp. TaxID=1872138 RepID=UPI00389A9AB8